MYFELADFARIVRRALAAERGQLVDTSSVVSTWRAAAEVDFLLAVVAHVIRRTLAHVAADHAVAVGAVQARILERAVVDEDLAVNAGISVRT